MESVEEQTENVEKEWKVNLRGIQLCSDDHMDLHGRRALDHRRGRGPGCSRRFLRGGLELLRQLRLRLLRVCWLPQRQKPGGKGSIILDSMYWIYDS